MDRSIRSSDLRHLLFVFGFGIAGVVNMAPSLAQEMCGGTTYPFPYTDVSAVGPAFCPGIMEAYVTGISKGTTPTTFSPNENVSRVQMTTFLQRSLDQGLARTSRRGGLNQWWTPQNGAQLQQIVLLGTPQFCAADGENIWMTAQGTVIQVHASTGASLGIWTGAVNSEGVVVAIGKVFATGETSPGSLYLIDPTMPPGSVTVTGAVLGDKPVGIAYDGVKLWSANFGPPGSVSIINPQFYSVNTVTTGFTQPYGILYDGAHIWVTDQGAGKLFKLDASGNILQTVTVGAAPGIPAFDGADIWVPNQTDNSITVVQASTGNVVATINQNATNHLDGPSTASFDGERVLVTNPASTSVTVFKAADLSFISYVITAADSIGACSDAINFWLPDQNGYLWRF